MQDLSLHGYRLLISWGIQNRIGKEHPFHRVSTQHRGVSSVPALSLSAIRCLQCRGIFWLWRRGEGGFASKPSCISLSRACIEESISRLDSKDCIMECGCAWVEEIEHREKEAKLGRERERERDKRLQSYGSWYARQDSCDVPCAFSKLRQGCLHCRCRQRCKIHV